MIEGKIRVKTEEKRSLRKKEKAEKEAEKEREEEELGSLYKSTRSRRSP